MKKAKVMKIMLLLTCIISKASNKLNKVISLIWSITVSPGNLFRIVAESQVLVTNNFLVLLLILMNNC